MVHRGKKKNSKLCGKGGSWPGKARTVRPLTMWKGVWAVSLGEAGYGLLKKLNCFLWFSWDWIERQWNCEDIERKAWERRPGTLNSRIKSTFPTGKGQQLQAPLIKQNIAYWGSLFFYRHLKQKMSNSVNKPCLHRIFNLECSALPSHS